MNLLEYIRKSFRTPNVAVLKSLGANDKLIEYLKETPWNTNMNMISSIGGSTPSERKAIVGTAIVGQDKVSSDDSVEKLPKILSIGSRNGFIMAEDSDFSSFSEAFNYIQENSSIDEFSHKYISEDYVILKYMGTNITTDEGGHVDDDAIEWYANDMVYILYENSFTAVDDN